MIKTKDISAEEKILTAAKRVFENKGMVGARMQEIADEAKINKSLLHYYYRSKQLLFEAVFKTAFSKLAPQINTILNSDQSICDKIKNFSNNYTTFMIKHPYLPNFILQELNRNPDFVKELISSKTFPSMKNFQNQIRDAVNEGKIRPIKAEQLFINILALNIFPFVGAPLIKGFINTTDKEYITVLEQRKTEVSDFIIQSIKLK
ncbi:MAG: TetR/AcrR family transcriptional regulator [Flavobacteriaceae bacterium]|nr:TetR/AcrR family transcriptional regulator [Flavobacteriaceae bacterium]